MLISECCDIVVSENAEYCDVHVVQGLLLINALLVDPVLVVYFLLM